MKPSIAQAETLFQNFLKLGAKPAPSDSEHQFKGSLLLDKLLEIE
jgi:hypothetical protein